VGAGEIERQHVLRSSESIYVPRKANGSNADRSSMNEPANKESMSGGAVNMVVDNLPYLRSLVAWLHRAERSPVGMQLRTVSDC
jgi:hypothetical protein